ncbi:MAG: MATE family efflux transporter, partial [Fusobacteriaceae bacterium]
MKKNIIKKEFYKNFIGIGLPLVIQQFLSSSLNFVDNLMIGKLGTEYIAAVGFANQTYKIQDLFLFGAYSGMGVFISQYNGKKDFKTIKKILGGMIVVGFILSLLFTIMGLFFSEEIISIFTKDKKVLEIGSIYLKLSSLSYIVSSFAFAISFTLRSIGKTKLPMIAAGVGIVINTLLNYLLIYGNFGFPRLEEKGAAIATVIARVIQFIIIMYLVYIYDYGLKDKLRKYWGLSINLIREMIKVSIPIFMTEAFWILGTITLTIAYSRLGTNEAAAIQIADVILSFAAIIFMGISSATSVIIGKSIGSGKKRLATIYSSRALKLAVIFSIFTVIVLQLLTEPILNLYNLNDNVYKMVLLTMRVFGVAIFFKLINWTLMVGILRAGGDTKIAFILDTFTLYIFAIPIAFICVY